MCNVTDAILLLSCNNTKKLERLKLSYQSITDVEIAIISECLCDDKCVALQELDLSNNKISVLGANLLGTAMQVNKTLCSLLIAYNNISDSGAIAIGNCLNNTKIQELDVSRNNIGDKGAIYSYHKCLSHY